MTSAVTVVIPVHNGSRFLAQTLESLLRQTTRDFTIVCVDDASTDDSRAVIQSFASRGVRLVCNDRRLGLASNWNRGVEEVPTPYFVLAHQDDVYEPEYVAVMLELIEGHPRAFMAHCKTISIDEDGRRCDTPAARFKETLWPPEDPYENAIVEELPRLGRGNFIVCPSVIFRTAAVRTIGPFDPALHFVTDWEYWIRGIRAGYTIAGTHERLMYFRRHQDTATKSLEASFERYREEVAMQEIIRDAAAAASVQLPSYEGPVIAIMLSEFSTLLKAGESGRAAELLAFAEAEVPHFRNSMASKAMRVAMPLGRFGGRGLKTLEDWYLSLATRWISRGPKR